MSPAAGALAPLAAVLQRYAYAYTAMHDFSVADQIIVDDYRLIMGDWTAVGREEEYKPATAKQYRQFPGLGFAVHDLVLGEDRAALFFSEFGRSVMTGSAATWHGVSTYRWNGERLTECRVEQDYYGRRRQLESGVVDTVSAPAVDPWLVSPQPEDPATRSAVVSWLADPSFLMDAAVSLDSEPAGAARAEFGSAAIEVLDLFTAGPRAAFHVRVEGDYLGGLEGVPAGSSCLYASGIVDVVDGTVTSGRLVTDRLALARRLTA